MNHSLFESIPKEIVLNVSSMDLSIQSRNCNEQIDELLKKSVLVGGKRLRPLLTHLMGNLFSLSISKVAPYARSVELVHAASLSHDDVIDNATTRRGIPSINIQGTNKKAVLAGDYLLADVIVELTKAGNIHLVQEMATVIQELAEGEWIQLDASEDRKYSRDVIEKIALKKTASVMSYCSLAPAILSDSSPIIVEYCRDFGKNLGLAFQYMDDTLDFSDRSKKDSLLDLENGLVNSVLFEWLKFNPDLMEKFKKGENLRNLFTSTNLDKAISVVRKRAFSHLEKSREILQIISKEIKGEPGHIDKAMEPLIQILDYLGKREF